MPKQRDLVIACFAPMLVLTTGCAGEPDKDSVKIDVEIQEQKNKFLQVNNLPKKNYTEVDGDVYMYVAAPSKKDIEEGKIIGSILQFKYLGQDKSGFHIIGMFVDKYGIISIKKCKYPCKVIYEDGGKIPFNRDTIIGSVFEDAINGRLVIAKGYSFLDENKYKNDVSLKRIKSLPKDIRCQYSADGFKGRPYSFAINKSGESMLLMNNSKYGTFFDISHIDITKLIKDGIVWKNYDIVFSDNNQNVKIWHDWKNNIILARSKGGEWTKFNTQKCWNEVNKT